MSKWVKAADKINHTMQSAAGIATKDAQTNTPGQNYALNSYAFHSRQLINTLSTFLPAGFEKSKLRVSSLKSLPMINNMHHPEFLLFSKNTDKIATRFGQSTLQPLFCNLKMPVLSRYLNKAIQSQ